MFIKASTSQKYTLVKVKRWSTDSDTMFDLTGDDDPEPDVLLPLLTINTEDWKQMGSPNMITMELSAC